MQEILPTILALKHHPRTIFLSHRRQAENATIAREI